MDLYKLTVGAWRACNGDVGKGGPGVLLVRLREGHALRLDREPPFPDEMPGTAVPWNPSLATSTPDTSPPSPNTNSTDSPQNAVPAVPPEAPARGAGESAPEPNVSQAASPSEPASDQPSPTPPADQPPPSASSAASQSVAVTATDPPATERRRKR